MLSKKQIARKAIFSALCSGTTNVDHLRANFPEVFDSAYKIALDAFNRFQSRSRGGITKFTKTPTFKMLGLEFKDPKLPKE